MSPAPDASVRPSGLSQLHVLGQLPTASVPPARVRQWWSLIATRHAGNPWATKSVSLPASLTRDLAIRQGRLQFLYGRVSQLGFAKV